MANEPKRLVDINLNDAFGFATIVAALDGIKTTFAVPLQSLDWPGVCLFVYFFVFRMKMFIDDASHNFSADRTAGFIDIGVALASWVAFLIAAAAIGIDHEVSIQWFIVGLAISCVWVIVALVRRGDDSTHRYRWFLLFNAVHIAGLCAILRETTPATYVIVLIILTALVFADRLVTKPEEPVTAPT